MEFVTARLTFRDFRPGDFDAFYATTDDPEYRRFYPPAEMDREFWKGIFEGILSGSEAAERTVYQMAVCLPSGELIGTCGVRIEDSVHQQASFGCAMARSYWGEGYAYEAACCLIDFGFAGLSVHRLYAETNAENRRSRALAEQLGFHFEGEHREQKFFNGRWWNTAIYSLLAEEWHSPAARVSKFIGKFIPISHEVLLPYHAILVGGAILIPVPLLDEQVANLFHRRMIYALARTHGFQLTRREVDQLDLNDGFSLLLGIKFFFSKGITRLTGGLLGDLFAPLELKHAADFAAQTYYFGFLLGEVFKQFAYQPDRAADYCAAIRAAKAGKNLRLIQEIIADSFASSTDVVKGVALWLYRLFGFYERRSIRMIGQFIRHKLRIRREIDRPEEQRLDDLFDERQPEIDELLQKMVKPVMEAINRIPEDHFDLLRADLAKELRLRGLIVERDAAPEPVVSN